MEDKQLIPSECPSKAPINGFANILSNFTAFKARVYYSYNNVEQYTSLALSNGCSTGLRLRNTFNVSNFLSLVNSSSLREMTLIFILNYFSEHLFQTPKIIKFSLFCIDEYK